MCSRLHTHSGLHSRSKLHTHSTLHTHITHAQITHTQWVTHRLHTVGYTHSRSYTAGYTHTAGHIHTAQGQGRHVTSTEQVLAGCSGWEPGIQGNWPKEQAPGSNPRNGPGVLGYLEQGTCTIQD